MAFEPTRHYLTGSGVNWDDRKIVLWDIDPQLTIDDIQRFNFSAAGHLEGFGDFAAGLPGIELGVADQP